MTTSDTYIKMCRTADPIQHYKYQKGFDEGDLVYDGNIVRVVGHDFLLVSTQHRHAMQSVFRFAIMEDTNFNMEFDGLEITHKDGKYHIDTISNPVWLPRSDQIISLICEYKNISVKDVISMFSVFVDTHCKHSSLSTHEQYVLSFYMYIIHDVMFFMGIDGACRWRVEYEYNDTKTNGLGEYINEHATRGPCTCGRCIDAPQHPGEHQPVGHVSEVVFFKVSLKNKPDPLIFKRLIENHNSTYCDIDLFDRKEHSYLEIGAWVGDQGIALTLMGMGELLGVWKLLTPASLGISGELAEQMAGMGMISIVCEDKE